MMQYWSKKEGRKGDEKKKNYKKLKEDKDE